MSDATLDTGFSQNDDVLLKIASNGLSVQDFVKRLQENDILVAVDGQIYRDSPKNLHKLFESSGNGEGWLMTFWRDGQVFDLMLFSPPDSQFGFATVEETKWVLDDFSRHKYYNFSDYQNFEIYRGRDGVCDILTMRKDMMSLLFPLLWCLNYRLILPAAVLLICYSLTFSINLWLFLITYIVLSRFVYLSQNNILRSFTRFQDKEHYMTIAATNERDVAKIVYQIHPANKIRFLNDKQFTVGENSESVPKKFRNT